MKPNIIDVDIRAKAPALSRLGVSQSEFVSALDAALESLAASDESRWPAAADIPICIRGQQQRLGDVAAIRVQLAA